MMASEWLQERRALQRRPWQLMNMDSFFLILDTNQSSVGWSLSSSLSSLDSFSFSMRGSSSSLMVTFFIFELSIIIRTMDEERREEEWLNMRSRGLNSNDVFPSKERIVYVQLRDPSDEGLRSEGFQMTDRNIHYRKIEAQGKPIGYEILHRQRNQLQSVRTGADYISQGLRTIALETRDIISDLIQLDKLLKAREFEDTSAIIP